MVFGPPLLRRSSPDLAAAFCVVTLNLSPIANGTKGDPSVRRAPAESVRRSQRDELFLVPANRECHVCPTLDMRYLLLDRKFLLIGIRS